jgi:RNA polymerase sigma-70 factor (ECF subfamily)
MGQPDPDLIQSWRRGDPAAFEALVRRWQGPVARFLSRLVGRHDLVADLCQEVFLRLYLARERYRESGAFSTWLYQIALNVARDAARKDRRAARHLPEPPTEVQDLAAARYERRELAEAVARALAELPPPLREVLVLRHYEGLTFDRIARVLGAPASTLKSRFAAALERLRPKLEQLGWSREETR